ncbi:unnamed protein product, partial [Closterium sp. NIES-54]
RAAPHSSSFPPTTAPLQSLHMDVWGPARVSGQSRERYFLLTFTLPDSPQQNGIAECRIDLVMEVARTSMIHAAAPHFLWLFAVQYAAHQLNLWPRVSLPETSPTLRWTGEVGDASVFRFYHPTSCRVLSSQDVTFDESVTIYRLFPYRSTPPPPSPLFLAPSPPPVDPLPGPAPVLVDVGPGAARGAASGGAESGGAGSEGAETGGAESEGAETGGAEPSGVGTGGAELEGVEPGVAASEGTESGGAKPQGAASSRGSAGALQRLSPQQLREWFVRRARLRGGATGVGGAGAAGAGGAGVAARASGAGGAATTGPGAGGARAAGAGAGDTSADGRWLEEEPVRRWTRVDGADRLRGLRRRGSRINCATLSSTESKYVAATHASKEGRGLRFLLAEFKLLDAGKPTILCVDNKSAITVAKGLGLTCVLKHME